MRDPALRETGQSDPASILTRVQTDTDTLPPALPPPAPHLLLPHRLGDVFNFAFLLQETVFVDATSKAGKDLLNLELQGKVKTAWPDNIKELLGAQGLLFLDGDAHARLRQCVCADTQPVSKPSCRLRLVSRRDTTTQPPNALPWWPARRAAAPAFSKPFIRTCLPLVQQNALRCASYIHSKQPPPLRRCGQRSAIDHYQPELVVSVTNPLVRH